MKTKTDDCMVTLRETFSKESLEMTLGAALAINGNEPNRALGALVVALVWLDDLFPDKGGIESVARLLIGASRRAGRKLRSELGDVENYVFQVHRKGETLREHLDQEASLILEQEGWLIARTAHETGSSRLRGFAERYQAWQAKVRAFREKYPNDWPVPEDNS